MNTRPPHPLRRHALAGALAAALLLVAPAAALAANSWTYATQDGTQLDLQFATDSGGAQQHALFTFTQNVQSLTCPNGRGTVAPAPDHNLKQADCSFSPPAAMGTAHAVMAAVIGCNDQIPYKATFAGGGPQDQTPLSSANNGNCPGGPPNPPPEMCPAGTPPLPHAPPNVGQASNPNQRFVMALYQDLLGRPADTPGLATLTSLLGGGETRTQIAGVLLGSAEYRGNLVASMYQSYLRRPATPQERQAGIGALGDGTTTDETFRAAILGSAEYFQTCAHSDNQSFVMHLYQDLLGRPADMTGLATFTTALGQGASRSQVAKQIEQTSEYRMDLVNFDYQFFLRRMPLAGERTLFVNQLGGGLSDEALIGLLMGSPEYLGTQAHVTPVLLGAPILSGKGVLSVNVLLPTVQLQAVVLKVIGTMPPPALRAAATRVPRTAKVGRVSFGRVGKGRTHIHWNLKVRGHRLRPGRYLVILRAANRRGHLLQQFDPLSLRVRR